MKHKLYNKIGQIIGEYDDINKIYVTIRDKRKGEIFFKKNWFNGKYINMPIAIDKGILNTLIKKGCKTIKILILGVKTYSYLISFIPEGILKEGIEINYDKIKQGRNYTHFGSQIVFDGNKGIKGIGQTILNRKV